MINRKIEVNKENNELLNVILSNGYNSYRLEGCKLWEDEEDNNIELFNLIEEEVKLGNSEWVLIIKENEYV